MRVLELLESEWDNVPPQERTHIRDLAKRRASYEHRREILMMNLQKLYPNSDPTQQFAPWRVRDLPVEDFPPESRKYVAALKKLYKESEGFSKKEVNAKVNMRYARHDPELAYRHARYVRKG